MQTKNISISRKPVTAFEEVNNGYTKYKSLVGENNLHELTTEDYLNENQFYGLARAFNQKTPLSLLFKEVENQNIIEELAKFADTHPLFKMNATLHEDETDFETSQTFERKTLSIVIKDKKVEVVIL